VVVLPVFNIFPRVIKYCLLIRVHPFHVDVASSRNTSAVRLNHSPVLVAELDLPVVDSAAWCSCGGTLQSYTVVHSTDVTADC
jgi:hypothetical protein